MLFDFFSSFFSFNAKSVSVLYDVLFFFLSFNDILFVLRFFFGTDFIGPVQVFAFNLITINSSLKNPSNRFHNSVLFVIKIRK